MARPTTRPAPAPAQFEPYAPPLAHKVRINSVYLPACATNVAATIERVRAMAEALATARRKPRRGAAGTADQRDLFSTGADAAAQCISAVMQRKVAA